MARRRDFVVCGPLIDPGAGTDELEFGAPAARGDEGPPVFLVNGDTETATLIGIIGEQGCELLRHHPRPHHVGHSDSPRDGGASQAVQLRPGETHTLDAVRSEVWAAADTNSGGRNRVSSAKKSASFTAGSARQLRTVLVAALVAAAIAASVAAASGIAAVATTAFTREPAGV